MASEKRLLTVEPTITFDRLLFDQTIGTQIFVKDPKDNSKVLCEESRAEFFAWCETNCVGRYWVGMGFVRLELDEDLLLFKLSWL